MNADEKQRMLADSAAEEQAAVEAYRQKVIVPDENSATRWWPNLFRCDTLRPCLPMTEIVPFDLHGLGPILDGERTEEFERVRQNVWEAAQRIGLPCFVRTDQASAKHDGPRAYRLGCEEDLDRVLHMTFEDSWGLKDLEPVAFLIREWLDLEASFVAFGGHPIAREWRLFADSRGVRCWHFYWPEKAILSDHALPSDWKWQRQSMEDADWPIDLWPLAVAAAAAQHCISRQPWSVDFARDRRGRWWLIDMAQAECSWHPKECPNRFREEPA